MAATETSAAARLLPSYIQDTWWTPEDPEKVSEILDASTSEPVCLVSTRGWTPQRPWHTPARSASRAWGS